MNPDAVRQTARLAYRLGFRVVPPRTDGTKRPVSTWKRYQREQPPAAQMRDWYSNGHDPHGIGLVTGGTLECLEFEDMDVYQTYRDTAEAGGLGDVIDRIEAGYMESTPGGGIHWLYHCDLVEGNTKLASRPAEGQIREHWPQNVDVLIETRGEGGYVIIAPSYGPVHESGKPYTLLSGGLDTIAEISIDERYELFRLARAFDESPKPDYQPRDVAPVALDESTPGNDYIQQTNWQTLLEPHGWTFVFRRGDTEFWRRPGKDRGISATINGEGVSPDRLYVFTSSTVFEPNRSYTRFQAYTFLEHAGDFHAAAKELKSQGYGAQDDGSRLLRSVFDNYNSESDNDEDESSEDVDQPPTRFRIYSSQEMKDREPPPQLIRGVLTDESHSALFGTPGTYKSFVALEMASQIANGGLWFGYPTEQGTALYITGEGQASFGKRIRAWEIGHGKTNHVWTLPEAVQFPNAEDIKALAEALDYYLTEQPRFIVIDTLARATVGLDENNTEDMGRFTDGVDQIIKRYKCAVLTVHHSNRQGMYRGSSSLHGAWDSMIEAKKDDSENVTLTSFKQKDLDDFRPINLRPDIVEVVPGEGLRPPITSIIMHEESSGILTHSAKVALDILTEQFPDGTYNQAWEETCIEAGVPRRTFFRCKKQLADLGLMTTSAGVYYPTRNVRP